MIDKKDKTKVVGKRETCFVYKKCHLSFEKNRRLKVNQIETNLSKFAKYKFGHAFFFLLFGTDRDNLFCIFLNFSSMKSLKGDLESFQFLFFCQIQFCK